MWDKVETEHFLGAKDPRKSRKFDGDNVYIRYFMCSRNSVKACRRVSGENFFGCFSGRERSMKKYKFDWDKVYSVTIES